MWIVLKWKASGGVEKALNTAVYVSGGPFSDKRGKELDLSCGAARLSNKAP